jgi:O-antigen biosynthesis protein
MPRSVSVVVPVKDGIQYLGELLDAVLAQAPDADGLEILVVDSGSRDGSVELAKAKSARVLEIAAAEFGHGRTRNLGAESTSGEIIAFLTQDATPLPGWLAAIQEGFDLGEQVGAVYGPHRARPDTSPMIARELETFFATHAGPGGGPAVQRDGGDTFLSNVNAAYRRDCWEQLRFADVVYSEDQAFGRAMLAAGWEKVFHPGAAVLHAHDYPPAQFMRRYFDEYRGLRNSIGHVEPFGIRSGARDVRALVAADRAWMREQGYAQRELHGWTARALVHHSGRKLFSALGSRAERLPAPVQRRVSLEGTVNGDDASPGPPHGRPVRAGHPALWDAVRRLAKEGPGPLLAPRSGPDAAAPLHIACVIPPFRRNSGGHNSIFQIMSRLEQLGHSVSIWIHDDLGLMDGDRAARIRRDICEWFAPIEGPVYKGFDDWFGADVAVATGWQTAHPVMLLPQCHARAYLVHDHETEFYATSVESRWAEATYGLGMHAICASPWLADIVSERYGGTTSLFNFGVDHASYRPRPVPRRRDMVVVYGRAVTPRRAVPLALMALQELRERRPDLRIVSFGNEEIIAAPIDYEHVGVLSAQELSWLYSEATVGVVLSLTNYSLIPQEMLACGLPCVDLAGISAEGIFGGDGPVALSDFDPLELAGVIERLLRDEDEWQRRSRAGIEFVAERTWDRATAEVEQGLRAAIGTRLAPQP